MKSVKDYIVTIDNSGDRIALIGLSYLEGLDVLSKYDLETVVQY